MLRYPFLDKNLFGISVNETFRRKIIPVLTTYMVYWDTEYSGHSKTFPPLFFFLQPTSCNSAHLKL